MEAVAAGTLNIILMTAFRLMMMNMVAIKFARNLSQISFPVASQRHENLRNNEVYQTIRQYHTEKPTVNSGSARDMSSPGQLVHRHADNNKIKTHGIDKGCREDYRVALGDCTANALNPNCLNQST